MSRALGVRLDSSPSDRQERVAVSVNLVDRPEAGPKNRGLKNWGVRHVTRSMLLGGIIAAALCVAAVPASSHGGGAGRVLCKTHEAYVFAHEDDVLLFMMPAVSDAIAAGDCVRLIELTAGDAGTGVAGYWQGREAGLRVALASIAAEPNAWTKRDARIPDHPATFWKLKGNPRLTVVFLNLPDGQSEGTGFNATGYQSLYKLWEKQISSMTTVDKKSTYTRPELIQTIAGLIRTSSATVVGIQDYTAPFTTVSPHDHFDHVAGALFTKLALTQYQIPATLIGYQDYSISGLGENLTPEQTTLKQDAFELYVPHDSEVQTVCETDSACSASTFAPYWSREYPLPPIKPG
jgi:LmbE family N-acetylglucosaminyl deacetylase